MRRAAVVVSVSGLVAVVVAGTARAAPLDLAPITQLKPLYLQTELASGGEPRAAIVVPDDPAYADLAQRLAEGLRQSCGATLPILRPADVLAQLPPRQHLIALGLFANNAVVEDLYLREFVLCDYAWPGGETSFVIRTVHNPWLNGRNVVYLGSATPAGCRAAVDRFLALLAEGRRGSVGPVIEVVRDGTPAAPPPETAVAVILRDLQRTAAQDRAYAAAAASANNYFLTGQPAYAHLFLAAMRKIDELHAQQADVAAPSNCQFLFHWFDGIEEGPAFSDAERLELTNLLYRFAARLPEARGVLKPLASSAGNQNMASAYAALYFSRYYPQLELSQRLLANMDAFYAPDMQAWKPPEDSPHYANITVVRSFRWALQRPERVYLDQGRLRQIADYYMLISNNLGQLSGIGDFSGLGHEGQLVESYLLAAWLYRDGRYLWWWDHFAGPTPNSVSAGKGFYRGRGQGLMGWVPEEVIPRRRPDDLLGIARAPLDRWIYQRRDVAQFLGRSYEETHRFPLEACYDKVAFRAGWEREDQYLCLSGFGWGYHSHPHANAIVNYSDQGRTMLYDDGYMVAQPSEHNTLIVLRDGWTQGIPELAEVVAQANFPELGLFVSRLDDYSGLCWDRTILWPRGRYFLVVDDLQARQAGRYSLQCIWRALGSAKLEGRRWTSDNPPGRFHLQACGDARLTQKPSAGTNLNDPPFPPDQARRLVESVSLSLDAGQGYQFGNLLYSTPLSDADRRVEAYRLADSTAYLVEDEGRLALAGVRRCDQVPGMAIEGAAFHLLGDTLSVAGARRIDVGGPLLQADVPVNVRIDLASGVTTLDLPSATTITLTGASKPELRQFPPGAHAVQLRPLPAATRQALAGQLRAAFDRLAGTPTVPAPVSQTARPIQRLWEYRAADSDDAPAIGSSPHPNAVRVADLDGDGRPEILAAGPDHALHAIGADGRRRWRHELPREILDLAVSGSGPACRIVAGCGDNRVYALSADGALRWSALPRAKSYARPGYREGDINVHQGQPVVVLASDLNGDGRSQVIVGSDNGFVYAFDDAGQPLWDTLSHTPHSMTCAAACDLDGDGRREIILGNIYGYAQIFSADGQLFGRGGGTGHAGAVVAAAGDPLGDGHPLLAVGDKLGKLFLQRAPEKGMWSAQQNTREYNTGSDITAVALADVDGDGRLETVAASRNFLLYLFDPAGRPLWHVNLGDVCLELDVAPASGPRPAEIVCGCEDGTVQILDAGGRLVAREQLPAAVRSLRSCELDGRPETREIVAGSEDGRVYGLQAAP